MSDLSHFSTFRSPTYWGGTWDSFKTWWRAQTLHRNATSCDPLSRELVLCTDERVSLRQYRMDGTTFVVETSLGEERRVPASLIDRIEDKGDWGYV